METISNILADSVSGGFFKFVGYYLIIYVLIKTIAGIIIVLINRPLRHLNMIKNGYPPAYCDADGDFLKEENHIHFGKGYHEILKQNANNP